jgi:Mn2+/Fe2+ NRAMP family transporter
VQLLVCAAFVVYVAAGLLAHPDWALSGRSLVVPRLPFSREALLIATAMVGTTLALWGLAFIQSYAADKHLTAGDLTCERVDLAAGAVLTGVIGGFVVVACAATLHATGHREDPGCT